MAKIIGIVSNKPPTTPVLYEAYDNTCTFYWFNEIEAAFAFLITATLEELFIDEDFMSEAGPCTKKYRQMLEQIHPRLTIRLGNIKTTKKTQAPNRPFIHFPALDILLKNGDLKTVFQPIIQSEHDSPKIIGYECLARLEYNGIYCPPDFLFNYAHEKLALKQCDRICLMQSLAQAPKIPGQLTFINVRPQTLVESGFEGWLLRLCKKHQRGPEEFVIEITEQYCVISEHDLKEQCLKLHKMGFSLAVDDFGSGISNLSFVELIRPRYLKISGRFIKGLRRDEGCRKIIKNVLELAEDFSIKAIVENIEDADEWMSAKVLGAKMGQGYYFYKPMSLKELELVIKS